MSEGLLSSSQKGKIAEYFVATALIAASSGRLSPFVPVSDDHGVDLIVRDKATGRCVAIQVKSWLAQAQSERRGTVQFDVRKATYQGADDLILLALVLDVQTMAMEVSWVIPMSRLPDVAVQRADKYALVPSRSLTSRDRYSGYRCETTGSIVEAILRLV